LLQFLKPTYQQGMSIEERKQQIIEEFNVFDDWMDRYDYLIEEGKKLKPLDNQYKTDEFLIKGCQSRVWLVAQLNKDGKIEFQADSDAIITKGMIALLIRVYSNQKPDEVAKADIAFLDQIGLKDQLSPTRSNGLLSMVSQMRFYASAFEEKIRENDEKR